MSFQAVMVCNTIGMTVTFLVKNKKLIIICIIILPGSCVHFLEKSAFIFKCVLSVVFKNWYVLVTRKKIIL